MEAGDLETGMVMYTRGEIYAVREKGNFGNKA